jgi:hypothetical protein
MGGVDLRPAVAFAPRSLNPYKAFGTRTEGFIA